MKLNELLNFAEENVIDVSDLARVADIRRLSKDDLYRKVQIEDLRQRYADAAQTALRREDLGDNPIII